MAQNTSNKIIHQSILDKPTGLSYPKNAREVIERLNSWPKNELDAYERPEAYPNYMVSGETNGLVAVSKGMLEKLNVQITWHVAKKKYELAIYKAISMDQVTSGFVPPRLDAGLIYQIKDSMVLGTIVEILGPGWVGPFESVGVVTWYFTDESTLEILPRKYSTDEMVTFKGEGGSAKMWKNAMMDKH